MIFEIFVHPLIKLKPQNWHMQDWLEAMFLVEERSIRRYEALSNFDLPGKLKVSANIVSTLIKHKKVKAKDNVWIRIDKTEPRKVDVEVFTGVGGKSYLFELNRDQLRSIMPLLKEKPFKTRRERKPTWETDFYES